MSKTLVRSMAKPAFSLKWDGLRSYAIGTAWMSSTLIILILGTLIYQSGPALLTENLNLLSTNWDPHNGQYGIIPMIFGSLIVMSIAMFIAVPLGVLSAICLLYTSPSPRDRG